MKNPYDHQDIRYNSWDDGFREGFLNGYLCSDAFDFEDTDNRELINKAIHNAVMINSEAFLDLVYKAVVNVIYRRMEEENERRP